MTRVVVPGPVVLSAVPCADAKDLVGEFGVGADPARAPAIASRRSGLRAWVSQAEF